MCHEKYQYIECHRFDIHIRVWPGTTAFVYTLRPISIGDIIRLRKRPAETRAPLIVHCFTRGTLPMHGYHGLWYLSDRLTDADLTGSLFQTKKMHCHCNPPDYLRIQNAPNFPHGPLYNQPTSTLASAHLHLNMRGFSRNGVETTKKKTMNLHQLIRANWPQQQMGAGCNSLSPPDPVRFNRKKQFKHFLASSCVEGGFRGFTHNCKQTWRFNDILTIPCL